MSADVLQQMTKDELIRWVRKSVPARYRPNLFDVMMERWEIKSQELEQECQAERNRFQELGLDFKVRDALAMELNELIETKSLDERNELLKQIKVYDNHFSEHLRIMHQFTLRRRRLDQLFNKAMRQLGGSL